MVLQRLVVAELVLAVVAVAARQPLLKRRHMLARLEQLLERGNRVAHALALDHHGGGVA